MWLIIISFIILDDVKYSSSAVDSLAIFYQIKIFWEQLEWPDVEGSYTFVAKIVDVSNHQPSNMDENNYSDLHNSISFRIFVDAVSSTPIVSLIVSIPKNVHLQVNLQHPQLSEMTPAPKNGVLPLIISIMCVVVWSLLLKNWG